MALWSRWVGEGRRELVIEDEVFGTLRFSRGDGWQNGAFTLWDEPGVDLLIQAGPEGPSPRQRDAFVRFRDARTALLGRCLAAVDDVRRDMRAREGTFRISGLTIPSFEDGRRPPLWTLWFDLEGDDHFMYGVQSDDEWRTLVGFADD